MDYMIGTDGLNSFSRIYQQLSDVIVSFRVPGELQLCKALPQLRGLCVERHMLHFS